MLVTGDTKKAEEKLKKEEITQNEDSKKDD